MSDSSISSCKPFKIPLHIGMLYTLNHRPLVWPAGRAVEQQLGSDPREVCQQHLLLCGAHLEVRGSQPHLAALCVRRLTRTDACGHILLQFITFLSQACQVLGAEADEEHYSARTPHRMHLSLVERGAAQTLNDISQLQKECDGMTGRRRTTGRGGCQRSTTRRLSTTSSWPIRPTLTWPGRFWRPIRSA